MIDVKLPVRTAYYSLLNGALVYNAVVIPVSTDIKKLTDSKASTYVIISTQYGADTSTFSSFDSREDIVLDIVCKASTRVNKEVVDIIAGQIMNLVLPYPAVNGLPVQPNVQIDCVQLRADRYLDLVVKAENTVNRRILTFTQLVRQTGGSVIPTNTNATFQSPIYSIDFTDATTYLNPALNNSNYNLFLNTTHNYLVEGTDWIKQTGGGFKILLSGFNSGVNSYTIFIILK